MFLHAPEAVVVDVVVVKVVDMDVVALIRFMEMEIIPVNMLARMSDRGKKEKGKFTRLVRIRNCSGMVLFPSSDEVRKGEVTGSARAAQEKERSVMAWANVNAETKLVRGVDALWGKRDEEVAYDGGSRVGD